MKIKRMIAAIISAIFITLCIFSAAALFAGAAEIETGGIGQVEMEGIENNLTMTGIRNRYTGIRKDEDGNIYVYKQGRLMTGYFRFRGKNYYGHKTSSDKYPRGSVTRGQFRIRSGNRWYGYSIDGSRYERDVYYRWGRKKRQSLTVRKNHTVKYIWQITSTTARRYSTAARRFQREEWGSTGWKTDEGMQFIPEGWVDHQQ